MASRISSRQRRRVSFAGSGCYSRYGYRGSEGNIFGFGRWRRPASNFYGAVIADFSKIGPVEHKMCLIKASVPVATHFPVCVMDGASFFNRVLPRARIALFGANVSFELDWTFRKLVRLLGLRTGRFRGRLSCRVRPWPFCDGMFSRVGLWPFCVLHVFLCWTSPFLGNRVPKYGKMAEICGCERSLGSISVESTYSDSIIPGQNSRFRPRSQNHRSQPQISAIFS